MHSYPTDSPAAISRLLALAMIVDGHLSPLEAQALDKTAFLRQVKVDEDTFDHALRELCEDLLSNATNRCAGIVEIEPALLDGLLLEVRDPLLQICLWKAMIDIVEADGRLDDREMTLVRHAALAWFGRDQARADAPVSALAE